MYIKVQSKKSGWMYRILASDSQIYAGILGSIMGWWPPQALSAAGSFSQEVGIKPQKMGSQLAPILLLDIPKIALVEDSSLVTCLVVPRSGSNRLTFASYLESN